MRGGGGIGRIRGTRECDEPWGGTGPGAPCAGCWGVWSVPRGFSKFSLSELPRIGLKPEKADSVGVEEERRLLICDLRLEGITDVICSSVEASVRQFAKKRSFLQLYLFPVPSPRRCVPAFL